MSRLRRAAMVLPPVGLRRTHAYQFSGGTGVHPHERAQTVRRDQRALEAARLL